MEHVIKNYLKHIHIGRQQSYRNLVVFPLLSTHETTVAYITLDEALSGGLIHIEELDEAGSVPELKVINGSDKRVLILDGEELVGAKQNRVVNTTLLIQANSTTVIPVSCVEQGRWSYDTPRFYSEKRMMASTLRAMKARQVQESVTHSGRYQADQLAIWDEISAKAERLQVESPSQAMSSIFKKKRNSITDYVKHFRLVDTQLGAVFVINGEIVGTDTFGKSETFSDVFEKLVESYALDAIDWFDEAKKGKVFKKDVDKFLKASQNARIRHRPSVGLGTDIRLESEELTGFSLALDDKVLHLCIFSQKDNSNGIAYAARMQRFSNRRRSR